MIGTPFEKGNPGGPGRPKGSRNRITEAFLRDLQAEWEKSGPSVLKILAVESPGEFAKLANSLVPKAFDQEMPPVVRIITGVPRGDELPETIALPQVPVPQIPAAPKDPEPVPQIPAPKED